MSLFRRRTDSSEQVQALQAELDRLREALDLTGGHSLDEVVATMRSLTDATQQSGAAFEAITERLEALQGSLEDLHTDVAGLRRRIDEVENRQIIAGEQLGARLAGLEGRHTHETDQVRKAVAEAEAAARAHADEVAAQAAADREALGARLAGMETQLADTGSRLTGLDARAVTDRSALDETSARMSALDAKVGETAAALAAATTRLDTTKRQATEVAAGLAAVRASIDTTLADRLATVESSLDSRVAAVESSLDSRVTAVDASVTERVIAVEGSLAGQTAAIRDAVEQRIGTLEAGLADTVRRAVDDTIGTTLAEVEERVAAVEAQAGTDRAQLTALAGLMGGMQASIDANADRLGTLEQKTTADRQELTMHLGEAIAGLTATRTELGGRIEEVHGTLDRRLSDVTTNLGQQITSASNDAKNVTVRFDDFARQTSTRLARLEETANQDREYAEEFQAERLEEIERMVEEINPDRFVPRDWWQARFGDGATEDTAADLA
jgi:chromosome segregation ATPase